MSIISTLKTTPKRSLYVQIMFTVLAFAAMGVLSYFSMRNNVRENMVRNAETTLSLVQAQLNTDLREPIINLAGFARTIRTLILRGDNIDVLRDYIDDLSSYLYSNSARIESYDGLFGYFETFPGGPVFIGNTKWGLPPDFNPSERPWYRNTLVMDGEIAETLSYADAISGEDILIFSLCMFDDSGKRLGMVGMRIQLDILTDRIVKTALDRNGWGMLISNELTVIAHPNKNFVGMDARDPEFPPSVYAPQMRRGENISAGSMKDYHGDKSVTFFRRLSNGWYLGLVTPEGPFYQGLTNMAIILFSFSVTFAAILIGILIRIDAAKNKSDKESRHKSAFLANMSHEIRTPMNAIIGMTTIGRSAQKVEKKDHCFAKIQDASNHLLGVINDILDMSKIEANKFELAPEEFNFEKMLLRVVNVVNFRIDQKHQNFTVYIDQSIPKTIIGDDQRIAQVITNLLGNAIKFTPEEGSISLDTRFIEEKNDICTIQISVTDTGIGITPEQQERVFISFEQAEFSTTRKYGGTGLGLTISKSIVEMMGGKIWVDSKPGKGSTFAFTIQAKRGVQSHKGLLSPDVNLGNVRIMVVDDDKDILEYFMEISHEFKVHCDTAINGQEAIRLLEQNGYYHIYFVDWKMPGMDGIQLAARLKTIHESTKSVVIMITAAEWTVIETDARQAGVDKFLSKPLFPSHIADIINEALGINQKQVEEAQVDIDGIFAGYRILLVEDVEINREIVKALLEPTHIEIDCAENGREAVRKFSEAPYKYDIIFMDVQMPEMDGYEATRKIRALNVPQAETVKIVAMTANVFREDVEKCREAGMDAHIGKPLDFPDVLAKLRTYLPAKG